MKLAIRQLEGALKKGLDPLYVIHGAEALLALEAADRIREAARRAGHSEREVLFAEPGFDWGRLGAAGANLSLFASRRIMELRIPTGKPGAEGGRAIEAWCGKLPEDTVALVLLPELEWQQLRTSWVGPLEAAGKRGAEDATPRAPRPESRRAAPSDARRRRARVRPRRRIGA